ncbi:hypothetical protein IT402_01890, partial [Candidatus Nomurabacteria bacterium]|nr:hypothetical protein [Candidatus Nomurabacteria bacterium]
MAKKNQNYPKKPNMLPSGPKKTPPKKSLVSYIFSSILMFAVLVGIYSAIAGNINDKPEVVALSQVARLVDAGEIKNITVDGQDLDIEKTDGVKLKSKKEADSGLVETLSSYGVSTEKLSGVDITVASQNGFVFFLINILPILLPILFIGFFLWMLTRQAKGSGMQAFTFGQSKARITDPN